MDVIEIRNLTERTKIRCFPSPKGAKKKTTKEEGDYFIYVSPLITESAARA